MLISINDRDKKQVLQLLTDNKISYSEFIPCDNETEDVNAVLEYMDGFDADMLSETQMRDLMFDVTSSLMDYDYSDYNTYIEDQIKEWLEDNLEIYL